MVTDSEAYKYAKAFEVFTDPKAIQIFDFLRTTDEKTVEEIADEVDAGNNSVEESCYRLDDIGLLQKGSNDEGDTTYKVTSTSISKKMISAFDRL